MLILLLMGCVGPWVGVSIITWNKVSRKPGSKTRKLTTKVKLRKIFEHFIFVFNCDASDIVAETKDHVQDKANRLILIFKGCTTEHKIIHAINILSPKNGYYKLSLTRIVGPTIV